MKVKLLIIFLILIACIATLIFSSCSNRKADRLIHEVDTLIDGGRENGY